MSNTLREALESYVKAEAELDAALAANTPEQATATLKLVKPDEMIAWLTDLNSNWAVCRNTVLCKHWQALFERAYAAMDAAGRAGLAAMPLTKQRALGLARSYLYGVMGYLGVSHMKDEAVESVATRMMRDFGAATPGLSEEQVRQYVKEGLDCAAYSGECSHATTVDCVIARFREVNALRPPTGSPQEEGKS